MLGRDVVVAQGLALGVGPVEHLAQRRREVGLRLRAVDLGDAIEQFVDAIAERARCGAEPLQEREHHALGLRQQHGQEVLGLDQLVVALSRQGLRAGQRLLRFLRESVQVHLIYLHGASATTS